MMRLLVRAVRIGIKDLWLHRLRSLLTVLGVVFGVGSVVAMLAVGEGASAQALERLRKLREGFAGFLAMYHDQGLAPVKALAFRRAVNVTLGLPVLRNSPAHGTAFEMAGTGRADSTSMREALRWARRLAR